jgi:hypothetical protein
MKALLAIVLPMVLFVAGCSSNQHSIAENATTDTLTAAANDNMLIGAFSGSFGNNTITLLVTKVHKDTVEGRSVVAGNDRPFKGTVVVKEKALMVTAKEPGNHPNDGIFDWMLSSNTPASITGNWRPYIPTATLGAKNFTLQKKVFTYQPAIGTFPQASQRLLTSTDVENMLKEDLEYMRNEIFARHGYCFKKRSLREIFENEDWYIPYTADVTTLLTDIERKNIALIKRYEAYAEEYGDEFGR